MMPTDLDEISVHSRDCHSSTNPYVQHSSLTGSPKKKPRSFAWFSRPSQQFLFPFFVGILLWEFCRFVVSVSTKPIVDSSVVYESTLGIDSIRDYHWTAGKSYDWTTGNIVHWDVLGERIRRNSNSPGSVPARLAHTNPKRLIGSFLLPFRLARSIIEEQSRTTAKKKFSKHVWEEYFAPGTRNNRTSACRYCYKEGHSERCIPGQMFTQWGAEEEFHRDLGMANMLKKMFQAHDGNTKTAAYIRFATHRQKPLYRTLSFACELDAFPKVENGRVEIDLPKQTTALKEMTLQIQQQKKKTVFADLEVSSTSFLVQALPQGDLEPGSFESSIKNMPVVCGRQLFGTLDARHIARHVRHNRAMGFATTIMYEIGNSRILYPEALQEVIASGELTLIDWRSLFQNLFGTDAGFASIDSKAAAQTLTRWDCVYRLRPLEPSWIGFFDVDEYPLPGLNASPSNTLTDFLATIKDELKSTEAVLFFKVLDDSTSTLCASNRTQNLRYGGNIGLVEEQMRVQHEIQSRIEKEKIEQQDGKTPPEVRKSNDKFMVSPNVDLSNARVHIFPYSPVPEHHISTDDFFLQHNRCVNRILVVKKEK